MADRAGFTLLEAAVAVAVLSILAGSMAPLALKVLDQRREAATRRSLRLAFEALFGSRDHRVANMRADFGFGNDLERAHRRMTLEGMQDRGFVPAMGLHGGSRFLWGWNGPYWRGPTRDHQPLDAWGTPIELVVMDGAVQLQSRGPSRVRNGPGTLAYPPDPVPLASLDARIIVHVLPVSPGLDCFIRVRTGNSAAAALPLTFNPGPRPRREEAPVRTGEGRRDFVFSVPAGSLEIWAEPQPGTRPPPGGQSYPLDVLPGETREVTETL